ncbi:sulfatase-like hydrolase/transferase [Parasulfitobacter algicola]|uniref:Sulfatase-like hydrolase/transferase n=1 Tax=Parasulfitobacter algicola TaxID=2614809 RepID=A0ABX2IZC9_9RHOB|nr:sulfatase-like hydrolase/transferase [Sulfitobacter algicola]NSX55703.1 sulfatase-like hydrolase/transferase [Sulfitobacter algicola]
MAKRKNILLIAIDDGFAFWRYRTAFGATLKTPNLDRICSMSAAFTSAYCQVPICGPSRASVMSGLSPYETGVFDNYTNVFDVMRAEQFWSFRLKREGYYCSTAGKVHHGYKPLADDFHNALYSHPSRPVHFGPAKNAPAVDFGGKSGGKGTTDIKNDRQYYDFRSSQDALRFLQSYDQDAPFYREVGFHHPHPPFRTPVRFKEMYDLDDFIHPDDWALGFDLSEFTGRYMIENMDQNDIEAWKKSIRNYFSAYSHVDHHIGRVWNALQKSKHAKDTIFVLYSDHGYHMGDKGRFRKFTLWEEAARAPLIIHDPDSPARMVEDPVALTDVGPTILDYANCKPMQHSVGQSLRPVIEGKTQEKRAIPTFWYGSASARFGSHRITLYQDGSAEFYDLDNDMWLTKNLAHKHPEFESARKALLQTCAEYGVMIVEQGVPANQASSYVSALKGGQDFDDLPTNGIVSIGSLTPYGDSPGYRKQFATLDNNGTLHLAKGVDELHFASDTNGGVSHMKVVGNDRDNRIIFAGSHNRFTLEVHSGPGNNFIRTSHDRLIAYGGPGNDMIIGGVSDNIIHGGSGNDTLYGGPGNDELHGDAGNDELYGGDGNDTLYSGSGNNLLDGGPGVNLIVVEGGINRIMAEAGENTLLFKRTELPQTVHGFTRGVIDLSDWACLGPVSVVSQKGNVILTCVTERVVFKAADEQIVRECIKGNRIVGTQV